MLFRSICSLPTNSIGIKHKEYAMVCPSCLYQRSTMTTKKVYNMNEKKYKRIFTVVIDSLGAGEILDAASYGDAGTDTLGHIAVMLEKV